MTTMITMMIDALVPSSCRGDHIIPRERVVQSLSAAAGQFCTLVMVLVHIACNDIA